MLSEWTAARSATEAMETLSAGGVPAHAVQDSAAAAADPQLAHRGHFAELPHPSLEPTTVEGARMTFGRTPARRPEVAPTMGADTDAVLRELLGYDDERIAALAASGALQ